MPMTPHRPSVSPGDDQIRICRGPHCSLRVPYVYAYAWPAQLGFQKCRIYDAKHKQLVFQYSHTPSGDSAKTAGKTFYQRTSTDGTTWTKPRDLTAAIWPFRSGRESSRTWLMTRLGGRNATYYFSVATKSCLLGRLGAFFAVLPRVPSRTHPARSAPRDRGGWPIAIAMQARGPSRPKAAAF